MSNFLRLGIWKGIAWGLLGTGLGVGIAAGARVAMGLPAWHPEINLVVGIVFGVLFYLGGLGIFKYWFGWITGKRDLQDPKPSEPHWTRYFGYDINHKVIGIQYMATALTFLPFAVILQILARTDLAKISPPFMDLHTYTTLISDHGVTMLFIVAVPGFAGLMNYFVPILIGAKDMAFPKLNALSFWLVPPAGILIASAIGAGGFLTGWTIYPPLSAEFQPLGMDLILLGVYMAGLSSILTAINILSTVFKMRAPGMKPFRMPVFVWSSVATTLLSVVFTQSIAMALLMVLLERLMGMNFFNSNAGGFPLMYQYMFWFYSHPATYIFALPGLGIISDVIPVFVRKPLFGYKGVAISSPGIAAGGTIVFLHHMYVAGMPTVFRIPFMITTMIVAVPTGVKFFGWIATLWAGKIRLSAALLLVFSAVIIFLMGGLTGVIQAVVPANLYIHDTYWIVAHFHSVLFGGFLFPFAAGIYYWFPKMSGRMLSERLGKWQWFLMTVGAGLLIIPMFDLGLEGFRRRVGDYAPVLGYQPLHLTTAIGGTLIFIGLAIMVYNMLINGRKGKIAGDNPWKGKTLEWLTSSPPPEDNFVREPVVVAPPYEYGVPDGEQAPNLLQPAAAGEG
jgi:cytochrome c oxidase subunit 1